MEEELNQILTNDDLDANARAEAIRTLVGKNYIPVKKHTDTVNKLKTDYSAIQTEYSQFKETKMTDEEKTTEALRLAQEKSAKNNKMLCEMFAKNVFAEAGFKKEDYEEIVPTIIQEDPEVTKGLAEKICTTMLKQKENIEKQIKESIIKGQKKPEGGNDNQDGITELDKLKQAYNEAEKNNDRVAMATYTRLITETQLKK